MTQGVIAIFGQDGAEKLWKRLSARVPEFLQKYPVSDYRVEITVEDELSLNAGLLKLYEVCITAHRRPEEMGLPPISSFNRLLYTAKLIDKSNVVVRTASALGGIVSHKDHEKNETAALQRLLSYLGFCGEVLDSDESAAITDVGGAVERSPVSAIRVVETKGQSPSLRASSQQPGDVTTTTQAVHPASPILSAPTVVEEKKSRPTRERPRGKDEDNAKKDGTGATPAGIGGRPTESAVLLSLKRMIGQHLQSYGIESEPVLSLITEKEQAVKLNAALFKAKSKEEVEAVLATFTSRLAA